MKKIREFFRTYHISISIIIAALIIGHYIGKGAALIQAMLF